MSGCQVRIAKDIQCERPVFMRYWCNVETAEGTVTEKIGFCLIHEPKLEDGN